MSGGQTGADRAALEFAIRNGIPHDGWCPRGRLAEDGRIPDIYQLKETPSDDPSQRTQWNVRDSDATVIFCRDGRLSGGTALAAKWARTYEKPVLVLASNTDQYSGAKKLEEFLRVHRCVTLNVAGPRESEQPGIGNFVRHILKQWAGLKAEEQNGLR